jgi:hypothetical protein
MMRRTILLLTAALYGLALAQAAPAAPPGGGPTVPSALREAHVRFVHAAPNAGPLQLAMRHRVAGSQEQGIAVGLGYLEMTDHVGLVEGDYEFLLAFDGVVEAPIVLPQTLSAVRGRSYTVVLVGLAVAEGPAVADDGGFFAWLEGLFTPDRPELSLRALVLEDVAAMVPSPQEMHLRIVHAAPGTAEVELVQVTNGAVNALETVGYLDVGVFHPVLPGTGHFEVRAAGTAAPIAVLESLGLEPGFLHTVLLTGTPIEEVPLQAIVLTSAPVGP